MFILTEQQRLDAIKSCDRIQELCAQQQKSFEKIIKIFDNLAKGKAAIAQKPLEWFTVGKQPCQNFLRGDADIAALGEGNRRNLHQCPNCCGNRAWCDNCSSDHHDGGWESCQPGAYDYREDDE